MLIKLALSALALLALSAGAVHAQNAPLTPQGSDASGVQLQGDPLYLAHGLLYPDTTGHLKSRTLTPTLSSCGSGPSVVTGTDVAGHFTTGTGSPTACTLMFAATYNAAPHCVGSNGSKVTSRSTSAVTFTFAASSSTVIDYICIDGSGR